MTITKDQRALFEAAVVDRMKESGFLEIEIRTECLVRCDDGYQDEIINAGWHYWNAAVATTEPSKPVAEAVKVKPLYRHKARGTIYELVGIGMMQAANWEEREYTATDDPVAGVSVDMREVAIYRSVDNGAIWVRPIEEFNDGRFEPEAPLSGGEDGK
ncbi:hypothetical protein ACVITL_002876 [Rhizobium pisi]